MDKAIKFGHPLLPDPSMPIDLQSLTVILKRKGDAAMKNKTPVINEITHLVLLLMFLVSSILEDGKRKKLLFFPEVMNL